MSKPAPTFLIVEDYRKMAETIEVCLKRLRPHAGTMTAGSLMKARSLVERHGQPRAIVLDLNLPDSRGLTTLMAVRQMAPDAAVMVFSAIEPESKLQTAIEMGANCALARPRTGYVFVNEIEQWLLEVEETGPLQEHPDLRALGALQREVLALVAIGRDNQQIGEQLQLAEPAVGDLVAGILIGLGVQTREQAGLRYLEWTQARRA